MDRIQKGGAGEPAGGGGQGSLGPGSQLGKPTRHCYQLGGEALSVQHITGVSA